MSLTPQPIDSFSRFMANTFDERQFISVPTGFQAFFGNPAAGGMTHYSPDAGAVDIDIIRGNKKTAALIPRGIVSRTLGGTQQDMQGGKRTTFSRKFPLSEEEGNIGADQILYRVPGESSYNSGATRYDRMKQLAHNLHMESVRRTVRLFEVLAASSVLTGTMPAILGTSNEDLIYDFRRRDSHSIAVGTAWNASGSDVFSDIETACELIEADGNLIPDMLCVGGQAMAAMVGNAGFQALADVRRIEFIQVGDMPVPDKFARFVNSGWKPQGCLRTPKGYNLWLFTYNRTYQTDDGTATKLMPETQAFITSSSARCDRYFGPPETLPLTERLTLYRDLFGFDPKLPPMPANVLNGDAIIEPAMFHCDAYKASNGKVVSIRTQSAPIFATTQTDGFVVLTGLVA